VGIGYATELRLTKKKGEGIPVRIANDANVAALGEVKFGGGKDYENVIMLTLGTGVGGGAVLDGKLMEGNKGAGAEFGHSCISFGGEKCTCGRRGCLEAYASATALIRDTKRAMEKHPESAMWKVAPTLDKVDGATAFSQKDKDETAKAVVDHYIEMLGTGLCNIAAVFRPEAILLGGGVCAEGDNLIVPLQKYVDENIFAGKLGPRVEIITAKLGNKAGLVGGACLLF
jgi:glucokinase